MNLTPEQKDFIISLSNEMRTQDTRCTAQPYGLILTEEVIEVRDRDYASDCYVHWDEHQYFDFREFVDSVSEYYEDSENHPKWVDSINGCSCIADLSYALDYCEYGSEVPSVVWYSRTQVPTLMNSNFFLTEKGFNAYLDKDRHNLTKPESFGIHLRRNDEMAQVIEIIHAIADQIKTEPQQ